MAGDWLKMDHDLPEKPEVLAISEHLGIDSFGIVGRLHRVWSWFDKHTDDGNARSVTVAHIDALAAQKGFAESMILVGWLKNKNGVLHVPKFDRHISKSAKSRSLGRERVRNARSVTKPLPEKRREEKSIKKESKPKKEHPTVEQVRAYCDERNNGIDPQQFVDHYTANGWRVGKNPMKDWRAAVRTWERNNRNGTVCKVATDEDLAGWNAVTGGRG